jgi:predicted nucleotide-binding protein (sugar kinase/HSP70/actin superfamily)
MGDFWVVLRAVFDELGVDTVVPPRSSKKTVTLGTRYAPETVCFPLKLCLGNMIEAIDMGADAVLMAGGSGPCRFGYYAQVEKQALREQGKEVDFHLLEPPQTHPRELLASLAALLGRRCSRIPRALKIGWEKAVACDQVLRQSLLLRPREDSPGVASKLYSDAIRAVDESGSIAGIRKARDAFAEAAAAHYAPHDGRSELRVGVIGEIFMIIDQFANAGIDEKLGRLGVTVERKMTVTGWVRAHLFPWPWKRLPGPDPTSYASPYLNHFVGGDGIESVGHTVLGARERLDGMVHLLPFTCMPEIVAKSVLPQVTEDFGIPVLSLSLDEHTGEAGLMTRLEAFVDLLRARKEESLQ